MDKNTMGFASLYSLEYPKSARSGFILSIETGVQRYRWEHITQAYKQWRLAFSLLQHIVRSRKPSQLICLVELIAQLAEYEKKLHLYCCDTLGILLTMREAILIPD